MHIFIKTLSPANQNTVQRSGFFGSLFIASLIIFLHFPFAGYNNERYVTTRIGYGPCPKQVSLEEVKNSSTKEIKKRIEGYKRCSNAGEMRTIPFSEWRSKEPIIKWFSSVINTIVAFSFVLFIGVMWIWVFRNKNNG